MKSLLSVIVGILFAGGLIAFGINDEIRLGSLQGTVVMTESQKALPGATVIVRRLDDPTGVYHSYNTVKTDDAGRFDLGAVPAGWYSIETYSKAHSSKEIKFTVREGEAKEQTILTEPGVPYLRVFAAKHVFLPQSEPELTIEGFGQDPSLDITLYKVDFNKVVAGGGLQAVLQTAWRWDDGIRNEDPSVYKQLSTEQRPIERRDIEGAYVEAVNLDALPSGMYWVSAKAGKSLRSGTYLIVSDLALVTKRNGNTLHTFATHMETGKSVANADISVYSGSNKVANAKSNANGFATLSIPGQQNATVTAVATLGSERAIVPVYMYGESDARIKTAIFTDRPVYRPGHTVKYKGIARRLDGTQYSIPPNTPVQIDVQDADAISIAKATLQTDEFGGFSGSFDVNPESSTGYFTIYATILGSESSHDIQIAAYRKPDFEIDVVTEKPYFIRGERITGEVNVAYYFGGAVPEAKVDIGVYRRPHYGEYEEYFADYEGGESGEYIGEISAVTDGQGKARFSYDTRTLQDPESDYLYTFEATVSDDSGRYFDGSGSVRVTRGEFEVIAIPESYVVDLNADATVRIEAKTFDGKPIDRQLEVVYAMETWSDEKNIVTELGRTTVETKNGTATVSARASRAGRLTFSVSATDSRGNTILSRAGVWVPGEGDWNAGNLKSLAVTMDKHRYNVGDRARAVIVAPEAGDAWVTVEGSDIYESRRLQVEQGGNLVEFEVTDEMLPNAFVSVQFVKNATFYEGTAELAIDQTTQKMNVVITPDKSDYEPGDTATFKIKTVNASTNTPVIADLAFGLVDESIYAIREDRVDLLSEFYPMRYSSIYTGHSFQEIYLGDGDKDTVKLDIRRRFLDTAHWEPSVVTDANGEATVTVTLPDNLTTWRATARGLSETHSLAGQGTAKIVAAKPLMVRLNLPRFLVQTDEVEISATVNVSHQSMDASVTLEAEGVEILDAPRREASVSPDRPQTVRWRIRAQQPGPARFQVTAVSGAPNVTDAMETSMDVIAMGRLVDGYEVGETSSQRSLKINLENYIEGSGQLEIIAAASLFDTLTGSFDYLVDYPYGCIEQTMSRFVPTLVVSKTPLVATLSAETRAEIPKMLEDGFTRIRSNQNSDGSWGWWATDGGDPYMTGWVLENFAFAASVGHQPPPESRRSAIEWARSWLLENANYTEQKFSGRLWLIRGLAAVGDKEAASVALSKVNLADVKKTDDWVSVAFAAHRLGNTALATRAVDEIKRRARSQQNHVSWENNEWYGHATSAQATLALATIVPNDPFVPKAARYLLDSRRGAYWHSTQDTALALLALIKVQSQNPPVAESIMVKVLSGREEIEIGTIGIGSPKVFNIDIDKLSGRECTLQSDGGTVYFTANWRYRVNDQAVKTGMRGEGMTVSREYYSLRPRRLENGQLRLLPSGNPIQSVKAGDTVRSVVKITSDRAREFMMLEDPIPSGFEVLERGSDGIDQWEWFYWYSGLDIRDDRIVYFMRSLPKGESVIEYTLRAEQPGKATALPATLSNMYEPSDVAFTGARRIEVVR
jgi:uncharacterized protein YfaS (alpha-2-macroglobulin family)